VVRLPGGASATLAVGLVNSNFTVIFAHDAGLPTALAGRLPDFVHGDRAVPSCRDWHIAGATTLRAPNVVPLLAYLCISAFGFAAARALPGTQRSDLAPR
jgi:hypothetical protein